MSVVPSLALLSRRRAKTVWLKLTPDRVGLFMSAYPDADTSSNLTAVQKLYPFRAEPQNLGPPNPLIHSSILPQLSLNTTASQQHLHLLFLRTSSASCLHQSCSAGKMLHTHPFTCPQMAYLMDWSIVLNPSCELGI